MTLWIRRNDRAGNTQTRLPDKPYIIINIFLAGVIVIIFAYSGIFSPEKDNFPVQCIHEKITGEQCPSCGLSHSFSLIIRGRVDEAYTWNERGMIVFIFFASQLIMRLVFSWIYLKYPPIRKQLIMFDIIGSSVIFLIVFIPFLTYIFKLY